MDLRPIPNNQKTQYNKIVTHVVQSWQWGEFRKKLGLPLLRFGIYKKGKLQTVFQLTLHKIPLTNYYFGYLPKGPFPDKYLADALEKIAKDHNCIAIKVEPNVEKYQISNIKYQIDSRFMPSPKPLFTKFNYILDLTKSEEEILKNMHSKFRYNIKVAQKHGVIVEERTDDEAFKIYSDLYFETTKRQNYYGHNFNYHKLVWETLKKEGLARILIALHTPEGQKEKIPLVAWMLFNFKDTLYYPYGGSSDKYRNVMASNLIAWEAIRVGKRMKLKQFDLWGALPPDAPMDHPWQGFNTFKSRLGAKLVEYIGTYDLVLNKPVYIAFTQIDKFTKLKVLLLRLIGK